MKRIYILLTACLAMVACKRNNVSFTYSPEAPRAGQSVSFTNHSSRGEEWAWTFGDGGVSSMKSPSHVFKQPGKYRVMLKVDKKSSWTATKEIQVYDTVPTFVCDDSLFYVYEDYTFKAQVYNPYNYDVSYLWYMPTDIEGFTKPYFEVTDTTMDGSSLHLYFTRPMEAAFIALQIILNGDTTIAMTAFEVQDTPTNSVVFRCDSGDVRQRIFDNRAEEIKADQSATALLDAEQDTFQIYNRDTFLLSEMKSVFPELKGFHIAKRKFYYRTDDGLWVANIDGTYAVQIDDDVCNAMTLDMTDNRIYWATEDGVWYMPFVGSDNNQFVTYPTQLNDLEGVTVIAADPEKRLTTQP